MDLRSAIAVDTPARVFSFISSMSVDERLDRFLVLYELKLALRDKKQL